MAGGGPAGVFGLEVLILPEAGRKNMISGHKDFFVGLIKTHVPLGMAGSFDTGEYKVSNVYPVAFLQHGKKNRVSP